MRPPTGRAMAALLVVGLVLSSCGDGKQGGDAQSPPPTNADGTPLLGADGSGGDGAGEPDSFNGGGSGGGTGGAPSPSTTSPSKGSGGASTSTTTTTRTTSRAPNAPDSGARSGVGAFARTLLRPQPATRIVVELLVQPGAEPRQGSIDHLRQVLADESRKPVTLADRVTLPASDGTTTAAEIRSWADTYGRAPQGSDQAVLHVLFLKGEYSDPDDEDARTALGVAVRGDTVAIFKDTVKDAATPLVSAASIEDAVVVHEVGHLFGLVDIVLKTGREDPKHRGHSKNPDSVMYWAVEASVVGQVLDGPPSRNFDSADKADLAALRNGA